MVTTAIDGNVTVILLRVLWRLTIQSYFTGSDSIVENFWLAM